MHLTIISYPSTLDRHIEDAVPRIDGWSAKSERRIARCQHPGQLLQRVVEARDLVCRLDLFGHGSPGSITLGNRGEPLLTKDPATWARFKEVEDFLTKDAEIRLLGCETGIHEDGCGLLVGLSKLLCRTVWGSRTRIDWSDFQPAGFDSELAGRLLVSSTELGTTGAVGSVHRPGEEREKGLLELERLGVEVPRGYEPEGYAPMPAATLDAQGSRSDGLEVTIRGERRLIALETSPGRYFLLHWLSPEPAPAVEKLQQHFAFL